MDINKTQRLIYLIEKHHTGNPIQLSQKIGLSESSVHNYINRLKKDFNAPIKYNRIKETYYFSTKGALIWEWNNN
jgi:Mn-dependent DtxR family transcriptional regulator